MLIYMEHTINFIVKKQPNYFKEFGKVELRQIDEQQKYYVI